MKKELRRRMRAIRNALPADVRAGRSAAIVQKVLTLDEYVEADVVAGFSSLSTEVDVSGFIDAALGAGKRVALPRIDEEQLTLREIDGSTELERGAFDVLEPPQSCAMVADRDVRFILTPGLAFDPRGYRLGYGGGYYDRLLPRLSAACACAVGFDFQLVSELPNMRHDVQVRIVVTDARIVRA